MESSSSPFSSFFCNSENSTQVIKVSKQTKDVHVVVTSRHVVTIALLILNLHEFLEFFEKFVLQNIRKEVQINYRKKDWFFLFQKKKEIPTPLNY